MYILDKYYSKLNKTILTDPISGRPSKKFENGLTNSVNGDNKGLVDIPFRNVHIFSSVLYI